MNLPYIIRCLLHGRLRKHGHCWDCERPVFGDYVLCDRCSERGTVLVIDGEYAYAERDSDGACTWCGGEWYLQECDDPIQCCDPRCDGTWHPCTACNGTGKASQQWSW